MVKEVVDSTTMKRVFTRITYEIIERIAKRLEQLEGVTVPVGTLDITLYRDDQHDLNSHNEPQLNGNDIPVDITDKHVILIDDVLYTGRTIRAALDALMDLGRPKKISLAVLVDRGHRELPIRPDFVGKNIPTALNEQIKVAMQEIDEHDGITIEKLN